VRSGIDSKSVTPDRFTCVTQQVPAGEEVDRWERLVMKLMTGSTASW
jgi:hypothetical protein